MTAAALAHTRASEALRLPFEPPAGDWYVQQGYDQGTHTSYERYALDLARRDDGAGSLIVAPASGAIAWTDDVFGCVSIALGRDNLYLSSCHIEPLPSLAAGQSVTAGAPIGFVAVAGRRGNGGMPHVHIALYADPSGGRDRSQRVAQPFDGEFALAEFAFPAGQEHTGFDFGAPRPPSAPASRPGPPPAPDLPVQNIREGTNVIAYFGAALPPADAFAALGEGYVAAYEWDAASQMWLLDLAAAPEAGTIELIQPYRAYVVTSSSAVTLEPPADGPAAAAAAAAPRGGQPRRLQRRIARRGRTRRDTRRRTDGGVRVRRRQRDVGRLRARRRRGVDLLDLRAAPCLLARPHARRDPRPADRRDLRRVDHQANARYISA